MSLGSPSAQAFRFVLDKDGKKYDAYIDLYSHETDLHVLDTRYREQGASGDKWTFLIAPEVHDRNLGSDIETRIHLQDVLDKKINPKIKEVFNTTEEKPVKGIELARWYVTNTFQENNNVIKIVTG